MDLTKLIREVYESPDEEKREENGKVIGTEISTGNLSLLAIIEALGSKLTSTDVQDRVIAMSLLGHIFSSLKPDFLSSTELTFVVDFLCDRLKDQHLVIPKVILSILPIIKSINLPNGSVSKLLRQIFQEANVQSHTQRHRRSFFLIIQHLLRKNLPEMTELGSDFVMSFLQAMDGEKDPRNLLILFDFIPTILSNFPLGPFIEDFFEVLSCYFPIDFNPTAGSDVISRENLSESLHLCLSQTNQFAEQLIPLALGKLDSSVLEAKFDSLTLLRLCCERSYTAEDLNPHLGAIWHSMRREIFMGGNEEVEKLSNLFISSVFKRLSENDKILDAAVKMVFSECKHHLSEPELRLSQPAARILRSVADGSAASCSLVISLTLPLLYEQFILKTSNPERRGILGIMITMMSAIRYFSSLRLSTLLGKNWEEILWMWFSLLTHSHEDFVLLSLTAFTTLLENVKIGKSIHEENTFDLDEKNQDLLQAHLLSILSRDETSYQITFRVISTLAEFSLVHSNGFLRVSVPKLLAFIGDEDPADEKKEISDEKRKDILDCFVAVSDSLPVGKVVVGSLVKVMVKLKEERENYEAFVESLSQIIEKWSSGPEVEVKDFVGFVCTQLKEIIKLSINARINGKSTLYSQLVGIVRNLVRISDATRQQEVIDTFWNDRGTSIANLDVDLTQINGLLREGILGSLRPSIRISKKEDLMNSILEKVFTGSSSHEDEINFLTNSVENEILQELDSLANIRLYSTFLNKAEQTEFAMLLDDIEARLTKNLGNLEQEGTVDMEGNRVSPAEEALNINGRVDEIFIVNNTQKSVVTFFVWTVKALAMRGIPDLDVWIQAKMIRMMENLEFGHLVADGFSTLMTDSPESLNANSFCNYKFLYKQRIFQLSVPNLVRGYREASETKPNYIRALTGQLKHVPQILLQMELNNVMPLLVGSLDYQLPAEDEMDEVVISRNCLNSPLLLSSLTALMELLTPSATSSSGSEDSKKPPLMDYFMDMTPRLLRLAQYKGIMQIRILALKCLQRCAVFPIFVILPIKEEVIRVLQLCLDDPKRIVRKEAVRCRNIWILIGAPGGL